MKTRRERILGALKDTLSNFLYYDRKGDEDLGRGEIEEAVTLGEVSVEEMVEVFHDTLTSQCNPPPLQASEHG